MWSHNNNSKLSLILLIATQLIVSTILVEAGFLDDLKKIGHKDHQQQAQSSRNDNNNNNQVSGKAPVSTGTRIPPRIGRNFLKDDDGEDGDDLANQLSKMDKNPHKRKPHNLTNMLARFQNEQQQETAPVEEDQEQQEEEEEQHQPTRPARPAPRRPGASFASTNSKIDRVTSVRVPTSSNTEQDSGRSGRVRKPIRPLNSNSPKHPHLNAIMGSKIMHSDFWKKNLKDAYQQTKDMVMDIPTVVKDATDNLSALLQLDNRGRLLALIKEVDEDIQFVRSEFSTFTITWAPIMERALSYVGLDNLKKVSWKKSDELDFRGDALTTAAFGYEFMRLMMEWRQNLMLGHQAYKEYLNEVLAEQEKEKFNVDEEYLFQLGLLHNYILLNCWMELDNALKESRMKLDHLSLINDSKPKNYENNFFRDLIVMQEIYDPTVEEFKMERNQVVEALSQGGQSDDQYKDIDEYFEQFKEDVYNETGNIHRDLDLGFPEDIQEFMNRMEPELLYNQKIYEKSFLKELKQARDEAERE